MKEAEEYAEDMAMYYESAHGSIPSQFEKYLRKAVEYGYNKATEWHRVADRDLPSEEGGWVCNQDGLPCYYDWSTEQWLDCEGTQIRTTEWCNMPHKESE